MRKLIVLLALLSGCSFNTRIEYEVMYSVVSSVPCEIAYLDEDMKPVTVCGVTDYQRIIKRTYYNAHDIIKTPEFVLKERFCLGTIGITINGEGVTKDIAVLRCCEEELRYSAYIR